MLHPGKPPVSKDDLRAHVAKLHKANKAQVTLYGFKTDFGGGHSTGFGLIYDSVDDLKKFEPKYRFAGLGPVRLFGRACTLSGVNLQAAPRWRGCQEDADTQAVEGSQEEEAHDVGHGQARGEPGSQEGRGLLRLSGRECRHPCLVSQAAMGGEDAVDCALGLLGSSRVQQLRTAGIYFPIFATCLAIASCVVLCAAAGMPGYFGATSASRDGV